MLKSLIKTFSAFSRTELLRHVSWSFFGSVVSVGALLGVNILAGRLLGPTEYGKLNLVITIAQIVSILILFGMDKASLRFVAQANDKPSQSRILSSALQAVLLGGSFVTLIYFLLYPFIVRFFGAPPAILLIALFYGLFLSFRQLFDGFIRGLHRFKFQAISHSMESLLIIIVFAFFVYSTPVAAYPFYFFSLAIGYTLFILLCIHRLKSYFVAFDKKSFFTQFAFAKIYLVALIFATIFGSLDKLMIAKYMSFQDLGIYGVYYSASLNFTAQINTVLGNVFSPMFSKNLHKSSSILKKIDRLTLLLFLPMLALVMGFTALIVFLFGDAYPLIPGYVLGFGILAVVNMIFSFNAFMVSFYSKESIKMTTLWGNILNLFFFGTFFALVYRFGMSIGLVVQLLIFYQLANFSLCKYALYRVGAYRA